MMNAHWILLVGLILFLEMGCLVSCTQSPPSPWSACNDLAEEFISEHAEGEGFDTAVEALTAHTQTRPLPGTTLLAKEEEDSVTWHIFDGDGWIGEITAVQASDGLWFVSHGGWCVDE